MSRRTSIFLLGLLMPTLAVSFLSPVSTGQNGPSTPPTQSARGLQVDVDLVLVNVTVTDSRNRFIQGLSKEHFQVWEDRIEQEITTFEREDAPVSLGIVIDKSGSMGYKRPPKVVPGSGRAPSTWQTLIDQARSSAYSCLQDSLRDDEYFLIEFADSPQIVADYTNNVSQLREKLVFLGAGGSTALWDAIYAGVAKLQDATNKRKALLVLTDGEENHSRYSLSELKDALRERDVRIYTMDRVEVEIDGLQQVVKQSGGRVFRSSSPCKELAAELRNQYVLGYRSTNRAKDGAWRDIRVRINSANLPREIPKLSTRARAGYYATRD
jgi:Ca-activated chloride channel family protein